MYNTPGIPSVIRKRATTPPHLKVKKPSPQPQQQRQEGQQRQPQQQQQQQRGDAGVGGREQQELEAICHAGDILEAAKILDLNILRDTSLLWIAEEFWLSPLPDGWDELVTDDDEQLVYYVNAATGKSQWDHPLEDYYKGLIHMKKGCQELVDKAKMKQPPSDVEISEMADYFGVDLAKEHYCRHLLEEAVCMPLPPGWRDDESSGNFVHDGKGLSSSNHPLDPYFVESIRRMRASVRRKAAGAAGRGADGKSLTSEEQQRAVAMLLAARKEKKGALETLGLHPSATRHDVRKRFRHLSLLVHPDKNPQQEASEAFKILSEAFKKARTA